MAGGNVCTQEKKIIKNLNFEFQQNVDVSENDVSDNYQENSNWEADFTRDALDGFEDAYWNID